MEEWVGADLTAFARLVSGALDTHAPDGGPPSLDVDRPLGELKIPPLSLFLLVTQLQGANSDFELPEQADLSLFSIRDVHHYFTTMTPAHRAPGGTR